MQDEGWHCMPAVASTAAATNRRRRTLPALERQPMCLLYCSILSDSLPASSLLAAPSWALAVPERPRDGRSTSRDDFEAW